ncbi:MAG: hypothetical protein IJ681_06070 [Bacteroidales bacterium]|nr:hypothetical protein [Bacteroidales bacterium]
MKKLFLVAIALVFTNVTFAQKSFVEVNGTYSMFTQKTDFKVLGKTLTVEDDLNVTTFNLGYSTSLTKSWYIGAMLGYSTIKGDEDDNEVNLYALTPKLTYVYPLHPMFSWTPNCYVTFGYGKTDLGSVAGKDLGDINKLNIRIGISPLSFDINLTNKIAVNVTALTPYYNIMKYSYSEDKDRNFTQKDFVYLGGQIGVKFYL